MVPDQALEPRRIRIVFFAEGSRQPMALGKRNCSQMIINQDMNDGLPDNLALLVFENSGRRSIRLKGMLGIRGQANALGLDLMP